MKAFVKTVALTLVISATALFFSSYKKVEAAGVGAAVALDAGLYIIAAIATGIASCLTVEVIKELSEFVESNYFADSFTKDEEGLFSYHPLSDNQQMDAVVDAAVAQYNNKVKNNEISSTDTSSSLSSEAYSDCVSSGVKDVIGSGAAAGITMGITTVNGKPQKVTTTYAESTVEVFDYLGLEYKIVNDLTDIKIEHKGNIYAYYKPFIITTDNIIYSMDSHVFFSYKSGTSPYVRLSVSNYTSEYSISVREGKDSYRAFQFYEKNGILCCAFYLSTVDILKRLDRNQFIVSYPKLTSYPVLFSDKLEHTSVNSTNFTNDEATFKFKCNLDGSLMEANNILSLDIASVGYFIGNPSDVTLETAAKMLTGTENPVQGGTNTTYSDLSDIEKAIYALSKQQGITYEEMLEQSNLVIENGQIYLEGLDGVTHSIESLLSEFDKLLEQGDITNENIAASTEQLKAILEYLKGLNIEGLGEYIQQLETTLDGLKQGDEDREAILGDVLGQLQGLNDYINSLDIESIGANIKSITDSLSDFITAFKDTLFDGMTAPKVSFDYTPGDIIEHYTEQFPLYEQCKKLINNLFNYDDVLEPPNFSFYWDSNGDGVKEVYNPFDFSILETKLTNENMVDKSIFAVEIKVIDLIRYILAVIIYGFFVMRLIRRLPTLYGSGPFASM